MDRHRSSDPHLPAGRLRAGRLLARRGAAVAGATVLAGSTVLVGTGVAGASPAGGWGWTAFANWEQAAPSNGQGGGGFDVDVLAANPTVTVDGQQVALSSPDDITQLGGNIFVGWQNGVGPQGQPAADGTDFSTVTEYTPGGQLVNAWNLTGKADGLTADPFTGQVIATLNEDANSSLATIDPFAPAGDQVTTYAYNPPNPLPHGGGTDAISIYGPEILISASAPGTVPASATSPATSPAVYQATLTQTPGASTGTAKLTPLFFDGSTATVANLAQPVPSSLSPSPASWCPPAPAACTVPSAGTSTTLDLTDPDSSEVVPFTSPRFAGDFVLDSQGDEQQIYVAFPGTPFQQLSVLDLSQSIDDTAYITDPRGTLYATDQADNDVVAIRGGFTPGEAVVSATPSGANNAVNAPNYLATLSLGSGTVTAIPGLSAVVSSGLLYVPDPR